MPSQSRASSPPAAPGSWRWRSTPVDSFLLTLAGILPLALAVFGARAVPPASHDVEVVRAVGFGSTGLLRGFDVLLAAPAMLLPFGTFAFRASFAGALATGACGALTFVLGRSLVARVSPSRSSDAAHDPPGFAIDLRALGGVVAGAVALAASLGPAVQAEASVPGSAMAGAAMILAAVACSGLGANTSLVAFVLGLAASYGPWVFVASLAALAPRIASALSFARAHRADLKSRANFVPVARAALSFALGLFPLAVGLATRFRAPELALDGPMASSAFRANGALGDIVGFAHREIGSTALVAAISGAALVYLRPKARPLLASLVCVVATSFASQWLAGVPGPNARALRPEVSAGLFALYALSAVGLFALVGFIARLPMPFAKISAAFVVVLVLVLPVKAADETVADRARSDVLAEALWNEVAFGLPSPGSVLLVSEPRMLARVTAARVTGGVPSDLLVAPTFALGSTRASDALRAEPTLKLLYRDLVLGARPEDASLSDLAEARPLLASFDPRWGRTLARHFVPRGLTMTYAPEPRGETDRRRALDAFAREVGSVAKVVTPDASPELSALTATLLRARALVFAACGDRASLSRTIDVLATFAPDDPTAQTLTRRIVTSSPRGPIDIQDLRP